MATNEKIKNKGPIRVEAVLPTAIILALIWGYMHFFFDGHLRRGIEFAGSQIHGAEVNIENINTSFWKGTFHLRGLQITNKENPKQNLLAIDEIKFGMLWDALLRMKFVVDIASVEGIQLYSNRKKAGWIAPPPKPGKASPIQEVQQNAINQLQAENKGNAVSDAAKLLEGDSGKDILKDIQGELQAEKRIKTLSNELSSKESEWKDRLEKLPKPKELEALNERLKNLKFDTKDPKQFAKDLKELKEILKEADDKVDAYKSTSSALSGDIAKYQNEIKQIDDWIKKDIDDLEKKLNIPSLNSSDFAKSMFMNVVGAKLGSLQKYWVVAQEYMPPPKTAEQKAQAKAAQLVPRKRLAGKDYRFPVQKGYPLFWLKKAVISSKATSQGFSGDVAGQLTDLSTDPHIVSDPTQLSIKGDFKAQGIEGIRALLTLDHRTEQSKDTLEAVVASFPAPKMELAKGSVDISLDKAQGSSTLSALYQAGQINMLLKNEFGSPTFIVDAKSKSSKEAFTEILSGMRIVTLDASAKGAWNSLDIDIDSNLGKAIGEGVQKYIKAKVAALKLEIKNKVDNQVKGEREKLEANYSKLKKQVDDVLAKNKKDIEKAKDDLKAASKGKGSAQESAKEDLKKKGKDLLKKLKF